MAGSPELCEICHTTAFRYKCPRCLRRTCSAHCASTHKAQFTCNGERDKARYVPMNQYTWGTMMDDFTFLEDLGRKVDGWGKEIVERGFMAQRIDAQARGRGQGRGRGARGRLVSAAATRASGRREYLKLQLDLRDIDMELLPAGMQLQKINQSVWDANTKTALLTIELIFHPSVDTVALATNPPPLFRLLTHRNNVTSTISDLVRKNVAERCKKVGIIPEWVQDLAPPLDEQSRDIMYLVASDRKTHLGKLFKATDKMWHRLDAAQPLLKALKKLSFVEFPRIEVWDASIFKGTLVAVDGQLTHPGGDAPSPKRRKLNTEASRKVMGAMLGDYASDESSGPAALGALGAYESDGEAVDTELDHGEIAEGEPDGEPGGKVEEEYRADSEEDAAREASIHSEDDDDDGLLCTDSERRQC